MPGSPKKKAKAKTPAPPPKKVYVRKLRRVKVPEGRMRKADLARRIGCDEKTLRKYLDQNGAPSPDRRKTYDIKAVEAWVQDNAVGGAPRGALAALKIEAAKIDLEKARDSLARSRGEYISKEEASHTIVPLMTELGQLMRQLFVMELPSRYKGRDVIECSQINEAALDKVIARFRQGARPITSPPKPLDPELFHVEQSP